MKTVALTLFLSLFISGTVFTQPLKLYPGNRRYLEYKGEPVVLVTSAEHYGAVVNLDFDYLPYLQTLREGGFNYTRIFAGTYIEPTDNMFGIAHNTLAPESGRYLAPWVMEGDKYELNRFNPAYFERLKDFVEVAGLHGIVVEVTLFTSIYAEKAWKLSPFNENNNVNGAGDLDFHKVNTLYNGPLKSFQERYIRKVVTELNSYDNLFYEIQNEPWADNGNLAAYVNLEDETVFSRSWQKKVELANEVSMEWQSWVASVISETEANLPKKHLIAQNISNFQHDQKVLPKGVSMINFHYALPPAALLNQDIGGVCGLDETGFMPHKDQLYINQAWRFILSGGGLYNNLDYSFTVESETGNALIPETNPGWGGPEFRKKLSILVETLQEVPFYEMEATDQVLHPAGALTQYALGKAGEIYLVFLEKFKGLELLPSIPPSSYHVCWIHVDTGERREYNALITNHSKLESPFDEDQVVLLLRRSQETQN